MAFIDRFRRITSQGNYLPEIDGLRFLAITMVVVFHIQGYFSHKSTTTYKPNTGLTNQVLLVLSSWDKGVLLFFVISGFILALPFGNNILNGGKKVSLRSFYVRRVTRLEPPYIITMVCLFALLLVTRVYSFKVLLPSLLASLTYTHNVVFGTPLIAVVTWSLEVEIQFYLIAPLATKLYLGSKWMRRSIMTLLILLLPVIQHVAPVQTITLYTHLQYFLLGLLLADFYICKERITKVNNILFSTFTGLISLPVILFIDQQKSVVNSWIFLVAIFHFYHLVLFNPTWKKAFGIPLMAVIGGMCYSIYLWHFAIISIAGRFLIHYNITDNYLSNLLLFSLSLFVPILICSAFFFYVIEKPCMSKDWYKGLLTRARLATH